MRRLLARFTGDRKAATAIEYGLIAALIAIAIITGLSALGSNLNSQLAAIGTSLN
jgi:pilus assembly protein Flp/PilA